VLIGLAPWFFGLDQSHYARWLTVHVKDMLQLSTNAADIRKEFEQGKFTVQKTNRVFSAMSLDQAHEQNNDLVKGDGGIIGLTENDQSLQKWMVAGPEISRLVQEFEESLEMSAPKETKHHEQTSYYQKRFQQHLSAFITKTDEHGNPFSEESSELVSLLSKDIFDQDAVKSLHQLKVAGEAQFKAFQGRVLQEEGAPNFYDPITRNNFVLLHKPKKRPKSKSKLKLLSSRNDARLFARLYVSCQKREGNLTEFFRHENQPYPPSLADADGGMRHGNKADMLSVLSKLSPEQNPDTPAPQVSSVVYDGAAVIHMLDRNKAKPKTFGGYKDCVFIPYISTQHLSIERIDIVWDTYREDSLKASCREQRGTGSRRRVLDSVALPQNWQQFLRVNENKTELFNFLATAISQLSQSRLVVSTNGTEVVSNFSQFDSTSLSPCNQEEADTRIFLHVADQIRCGHKEVMIRTVDTDVVVIAVGLFYQLGANKLWISFGTGQNHRYISIHDLAHALGPDNSQSLLFFYSFTGCDTTSAFANKGKKTAWSVWSALPEATEVFKKLSNTPAKVLDGDMNMLERFTILMYDRSSPCLKVINCDALIFSRPY